MWVYKKKTRVSNSEAAKDRHSEKTEQRRGHNLAAQSKKKEKKLTAKKRDWLSNCMLGKNTGMDVR
mgnify:CR=1 FL=1